ncbi:LptF/LptG family permease [Lacibacterium aquatile]|uniref:LptF/LptG family permease n=1 Tax=Lacibacterium aquatile TaxID=1168082 RepID=A0ABW5DTY0_9PROT
MMPGILSRYLVLMLVKRVVASLAGFVGLLLLLATLDSATEILDRGLGAAGIGYFLWLRLPTAVDQAMILAMLVGSVTTFTLLSRRSEMIILRAAGITIYRIALMMLPALLIYAAAHFLLADQVKPVVQRDFALWWQATTPPEKLKDSRTVWFRASPDVVSAEAVRDSGRELLNVEIYKRSKQDGMLISRMWSPKAVYVDNAWLLYDAELIRVDGPRIFREGPFDTVWETSLRPEEAVDLANPLSTLGSGTIRSALDGEAPANRSQAYYLTHLNAAYATPLASFVMFILGLVCAYGDRRSMAGEKQALFSLGIGMAFMLVNGIMVAFGEAGAIPPALAAWGALTIFACVAGTILLRFEE